MTYTALIYNHMRDLFLETLDNMHEDIEQNYVHDDFNDDDISDILEKIIDLKTKIKWTL